MLEVVYPYRQYIGSGGRLVEQVHSNKMKSSEHPLNSRADTGTKLPNNATGKVKLACSYCGHTLNPQPSSRTNPHTLHFCLSRGLPSPQSLLLMRCFLDHLIYSIPSTTHFFFNHTFLLVAGVVLAIYNFPFQLTLCFSSATTTLSNMGSCMYQ